MKKCLLTFHEMTRLFGKVPFPCTSSGFLYGTSAGVIQYLDGSEGELSPTLFLAITLNVQLAYGDIHTLNIVAADGTKSKVKQTLINKKLMMLLKPTFL